MTSFFIERENRISRGFRSIFWVKVLAARFEAVESQSIQLEWFRIPDEICQNNHLAKISLRISIIQ